MGTELAITMAQTWRARRILSAASTVETGITPYPACAKTAFRMGANTLSAEIERTDGRIVLSRRLTLAFCVLVWFQYCPQIRAKASKKRLNFVKRCDCTGLRTPRFERHKAPSYIVRLP